jgi:hypothetical protein
MQMLLLLGAEGAHKDPPLKRFCEDCWDDYRNEGEMLG